MGAVHLPEAGAVELRQQFAQRRADQVFVLRGQHPHVFVGRLEQQHVIQRYDVDHVADAGLENTQAGDASRRHR